MATARLFYEFDLTVLDSNLRWFDNSLTAQFTETAVPNAFNSHRADIIAYPSNRLSLVDFGEALGIDLSGTPFVESVVVPLAVTGANWRSLVRENDLLVDQSGIPVEVTIPGRTSGSVNQFIFMEVSTLNRSVGIAGIEQGFALYTVPEPVTLAIWSLLGICGIGFGWRRRRKAARPRTHRGTDTRPRCTNRQRGSRG